MVEDPETGEDLVVDSVDDDGAPQTGDDPTLLLYRILHDEVRSRISHHYRSLLSGLSVVGVIIAYSLLSGELAFLAVVPVVVGLLAVQTIRQLNALLFISDHLTRIEAAYVDDHPLFNWARRFGMTGTDRRIERWGYNWSLVPAGIVLLVAILGYFAFIYVAYVVWPPSGVDILTVGLTPTGLLVIYLILTILVGMAGYSYYLHRAALTEK